MRKQIYTVYKISYSVIHEKLYVFINGRRPDGERVSQTVVNTKPYLYSRDKPERNELITKIEKKGLSLDNRELWKTYVKYPFNVRDIRQQAGFTYEADIPFSDRVRVDWGIKHTIETPIKPILRPDEIVSRSDLEPTPPVISVIDIETDDRQGVPNAKYPTAEVLSWAEYNSLKDRFVAFITTDLNVDDVVEHYAKEGKKVIVKVVDGEKRLFKALQKYYLKFTPDIISGWYVDKFDVAYLKERANKKRYPIFDFNRTAILDGMAGYKKLHKNEVVSGTLNYIAKEELKEEKMARVGTYEMYKNDPEWLLKYNIRDVDLTWRILKKQGTIPHFVGISQLFGCDLENFRYNSHAVKLDIYHNTHGIVCMPSSYQLRYKKMKQGGFVHAPYYGIIGPMFVLDLKTAYPSMIITFNLSNDSIIPADEVVPKGEYYSTPSGNRYRVDPIGLIPHLLLQGMQRRDDVKALMKAAEYKSDEYTKYHHQEFQLKTVYNTYFGLLGSPDFFLTSGDIASDITEITQEVQRWIEAELRKLGCIVRYSDTDGLFFTINGIEGLGRKKMIARGQKIARKIDETLNDFVKPFGIDPEQNRIHGELDYIADKFFQWGKKKKYVLTVMYDGKDVSKSPLKDRIVIKGAEAQRSNSSLFTRETQKKLFEIGLSKGEEGVRDYINEIYGNMKSGKLGRELGIPQGLNKGIAGNSQHMKSARYSNKHLGKNYEKGDKPWMYLVKGVKGKPKTDTVSLDWDDEPEDFGLILDPEANMQRHIVGPLSEILKALGVSLGEIVHNKKQLGGADYWNKFSGG
jgi:DNA polymerase elongation subunit (family B)